MGLHYRSSKCALLTAAFMLVFAAAAVDSATTLLQVEDVPLPPGSAEGPTVEVLSTTESESFLDMNRQLVTMLSDSYNKLLPCANW